MASSAAVSAPEITVAVPVKDRREQMLRCLDALLEQDHPSYEIIVLDNESTDGTPEACRARAANARVPVRVETVEGTVGRVRNRAKTLARGGLIAYTDSDCLPARDWLRAAAAPFARQPRLGIVCGRTLPEVPIEHGWPATIRVESLSHRYEACNLVVRREALLQADGFDESVGHFWEDTAAGYAVRRLGWEVAYVSDAVVYHDVTYPGFAWHLERMLRQSNLAAVLARYPEMRRDLLFWRVFAAPRDARFVGLLAAVLLGWRWPAARLLAVPYAVDRVTEQDSGALRPVWRGPKSELQAIVYDAARLIGTLRGAIRHRTLVL